MPAPAVVRIAPSPTGDPHVGTAYMALFNWLRGAAARAGGSSCASRTPTARATTPRASRRSSRRCAGSGLSWDEGPDVGGPAGPYRQSERTEALPRGTSRRCSPAGGAYRCFCTEERLEELRASQQAREGRRPATTACAAALLARGGRREAARGHGRTSCGSKVPKERVDVVHATSCAARSKIENTHDRRPGADEVGRLPDLPPRQRRGRPPDGRHARDPRARSGSPRRPSTCCSTSAFGWHGAALAAHAAAAQRRQAARSASARTPRRSRGTSEQGYLPEALLNFLGLMGYSPKDGAGGLLARRDARRLRRRAADGHGPGLRPREARRGSTASTSRRIAARARCATASSSTSSAARRRGARRRGHAARPRSARGSPARGGFARRPTSASCVLGTVPLVRERMRDARWSTRRSRAASSSTSVKGYPPRT